MGFLSKKFKVLALVLLFLSTIAFSQIVKEKASYFDNIAFKDFTLGVKTQPQYLQDVVNQIPNRTEWKAFITKFPQAEVYIDKYTGMPTLVNNISIPWISGDPFSPTQMSTMALKAKKFIRENIGIFPNLPVDNLVLNQGRSGPFGDDGYLWFVDFDVVYQGVPIEGARVVFRCNHGNLVQFGVEGVMPMADKINVLLNPNPSIDSQAAQEIAFNYAGGFNPKVDTIVNQGTLKFVPRLIGNEANGTFIYPLVWEVAFQRAGITGTWTAYVNAHTGDVLSFWDNNKYNTIQGGIYPISPTKTSEVKRPFPFADLGSSRYSNAGGGFSATSATTSTLSGKYVKISDKCGSISLASSTAPYSLDFGTSSGTDCTTPGFGGYGNTHAARSCYYHVTNAKVKAMKWLTSNTWLTGQLTANVNIAQTCNAYWNGSTINFFRSGGGCGNTGEIAAIFLHEFAHGLDTNDGNGFSPDEASGETYADIYAALLTRDSCIGPGFLSSNCTGYGDACTSCTGVRDIDYAKHSSGMPHTISNFVFTKCPVDSYYKGPCGREGHCESYPMSEAIWDLAARDLPAMGLDSDTSWFIMERIFMLTRSTSGSGYSCNTSTKTASGCSTSNWHQTFLVADDDDGNLSNGTPHAKAIYDAFNRHGIACTTSTQTNYGCSTALSAPSPTVTAGDSQVTISWSAVSGASKYYVLRNDLGCSYGYIRIAETTSTSYTDTEVGTGFTYYYRVVAVGSSAACMSPLSACKQATPAGGTTTYTISGTVTSGGAGLSGVTVTCGSASGTTDTSGNYTTSGLANGTYTCTPTKSGYTFTPTSTNVTINGANVTGINFTATAQSTDTQLTSGVGVNASVAKGEWKYYYITVPSGATSLEIKTTNATGDVDLYTQFNAKPTSSSYACRPYTSSGNETCTHSNPSAGTWWAGVYGYAAASYTITATITTQTATYTISGTIKDSSGAAVSSVTVNLTGAATKTTTTDSSGNYSFTGLANGSYTVTPSKSGCQFNPSSPSVTINGANQTVNFTATCTSGDTQLSNGVALANQSVSQGAWKYYYIVVPSGATSLEIKTTNASADVDLYTQYNAKPTSSSYACRPYTSSGNETCTHTNPTAGTWWAGVYGYAAATFTITATYTTSSGGGTIIQATYNPSGAQYKTPACTTVGAGCEATSTLLKCRDSVGPEPNQPNTINSSCADGTSGSCNVDESIESIKIATTDGANLADKKTVNVTVQAYCYGTADRVTLFYTTSVTSPTWSKVGSTQTCPGAGLRTLTWSFNLSGTAGSYQAVRAQITYNVDPGSTACYTGSYNDRDDLIFKLQ